MKTYIICDIVFLCPKEEKETKCWPQNRNVGGVGDICRIGNFFSPPPPPHCPGLVWHCIVATVSWQTGRSTGGRGGGGVHGSALGSAHGSAVQIGISKVWKGQVRAATWFCRVCSHN
jgi:hypothetical protein